MADYETIRAGKAVLTRSPMGIVSFVTTGGLRREFNGTDYNTARELFDAIKEGSAPEHPPVQIRHAPPRKPGDPLPEGVTEIRHPTKNAFAWDFNANRYVDGPE